MNYQTKYGQINVQAFDRWFDARCIDGNLIRASLQVGLHAEAELALLLAEAVRAGYIDVDKVRAAFTLAEKKVTDITASAEARGGV
jgi:hypothetical protein